jgi:hypothetical protein
MARPRCSRKDPKTFRSKGATVRRVSTYTRATDFLSEEVADCANSLVASDLPDSNWLAPQITPVAEACFKKCLREVFGFFVFRAMVGLIFTSECKELLGKCFLKTAT